MRSVGSLMVLSLLVSCADSDDEAPKAPTRAEQCVALRDHLVDIRLEGVDIDREQHARAHREAMGQAFLTECERDFDDATLTCALAAVDSSAVSTCIAAQVQP